MSRLSSVAMLTVATLIVAASLLGTTGCATWREPDATSLDRATEKLLPKHSSRPDRVVLRVQFIPYPKNSDTDALLSEIWALTDDAPLAWESRKAWSENGLRIGVAHSEQTIRERLASLDTGGDQLTDFLNDASVAGDVSRGTTTIPMKIGRRKELPLRHPIEGSHVVMLASGDQVEGRTLSAAQYVLSLGVSPADSVRQVRIDIRPEIQHGAAKQKYISSDAAIRIDSRRDAWTLDSLAIDWVTGANATLVIGPDEIETGLSATMLGGSDAQGDAERMLLLIHVDQVPAVL